jgi:glucose/arabinose dehydrogenase
MFRKLIGFLISSTLFLASASAFSQTFTSEDYKLTVTTVAEGLEYPWGMDFLPNDMMIVTERAGRVRTVSNQGQLSAPLKGVPKVVNNGQGGMLDVTLDPEFAKNNLIYVSYSEPGKGGSGTAVARAKLDIEHNRLEDLQVIFRQHPKSHGPHHYGSRLVFARDGTLFITIGERGELDRAQDFSINRGQVIRIHSDGSIPDDNPFIGRKGYRPEVWSYGHRNPQGAALHPLTSNLWTVEHGARGGDEVNIPKPGKNYGWPTIAYGKHYSGGKIGLGTHKAGMEQPVYYWDPSIAPSGMDFYSGNLFSKWKGNLIVGALKFRLLTRLVLDGEKVTREERLLEGLGERIRQVRQGPDGYIYLLTDSNEGRVLRLGLG